MSSSGQIKVITKKFRYLFIGETFLQEHQSGRHIFKQYLPLSPKQIPFLKGFQIMTLRTRLLKGTGREHFRDYADLTQRYIRTATLP
jgi:hypothetical protein